MRRTILAVEDEFLILDYLVDFLAEAGFEVVKASNADDALAILDTRSDIFALVTDIDMPGTMDGMKLAAAVRNRWPPVHVVVTTGKLKPKDFPQTMHFVPKPYTPERMLRVVTALH